MSNVTIAKLCCQICYKVVGAIKIIGRSCMLEFMLQEKAGPDGVNKAVKMTWRLCIWRKAKLNCLKQAERS